MPLLMAMHLCCSAQAALPRLVPVADADAPIAVALASSARDVYAAGHSSSSSSPPTFRTSPVVRAPALAKATPRPRPRLAAAVLGFVPFRSTCIAGLPYQILDMRPVLVLRAFMPLGAAP